MNLNKKFIGRTFFFFSFLGSMLLAYMQIALATYPSAYLKIITWTYSAVWLGLMGSGYLLFDYIKREGIDG